MAWARILGHESIIERFRQAVERGRLPHAYLFVGRDGIGKQLLARELAKAVLCLRGRGDACDLCPSCLKVEHGNHPDVTFVRRRDGGSKGEPRAQILIEQVREEIQDAIAYKPFEGRYKVFVVVDADRMTEEAQNCLLKTLEEPPPHSLLILIACRLEPFVDTVVSRCQIVRFRPLAASAVERILAEGHGVDPALARPLARLAQGSPGHALRCHGDGTFEAARSLLARLAGMQPGEEFTLSGELLDRARGDGASLADARERLKPMLDLVGLAWRDLFLRVTGQPEELRTWGDACDALAALGEGLGPAAAQHLAALAQETRDRLEANANLKLLLDRFVLDTGALLRHESPLAVR
ncbi:MAG TPA: DNA polymerase III subunit delta' [Planctomycetota bacterium]|nr:DNA polymerase III subunit delta' [Planctomycetota bacterium]HRR82582.1 DNA polymerase III subunit delta' [Planctomycetota bacterium]HRT95048.1 DNA polymerase III subunit delta' [Planctomycetota bacterium]